MKQRLLIFCLMVASLGLGSIQAQERTVHLNIEGIKFNSIYLLLKSFDGYHLISAQPVGEERWDVTIPDSLFSSYSMAMFVTSRSLDSAFYFKSDFATGALIYFDNQRESQLNLLYLGVDTTRTVYNFKPLPDSDPGIFRSLVFNKKRLEWERNDITYEKKVQNYIDLVKKYPTSYVLAKIVGLVFSGFKTADADAIYNEFTGKIKRTDQGLRMKDDLDRREQFFHFCNMVLPDSQTGVPTPIIQDTTKYTLVAFSASWCGPCHQQIPLLKQLYADLHPQLEIVYVSMDRSKTAKNWNELMKKEAIPWRSVLAGDREAEIKGKYSVPALPTTYLIYPDGRIESIEVGDKAKREWLSKLVKP